MRLGPVRPGSSDTLDVAISDDRRAIGVAFSTFEVEARGTSTRCDAAKSFAMTLPLIGGDDDAKLKFHVQGYAIVHKGATARLILRQNGRQRIAKSFPTGWDDSFLESLELPATPGVTYQLSTVVEVAHKPGTVGDAYLNVSAIDVDVS